MQTAHVDPPSVSLNWAACAIHEWRGAETSCSSPGLRPRRVGRAYARRAQWLTDRNRAVIGHAPHAVRDTAVFSDPSSARARRLERIAAKKAATFGPRFMHGLSRG